jgi:hypothetical protein
MAIAVSGSVQAVGADTAAATDPDDPFEGPGCYLLCDEEENMLDQS